MSLTLHVASNWHTRELHRLQEHVHAQPRLDLFDLSWILFCLISLFWFLLLLSVSPFRVLRFVFFGSVLQFFSFFLIFYFDCVYFSPFRNLLSIFLSFFLYICLLNCFRLFVFPCIALLLFICVCFPSLPFALHSLCFVSQNYLL